MADDAPALIPLDAAAALIWPVSADDPRLRLRIVRSPSTPEQREWLAKRHGYATILDPTGSGDARLFWQGHGREPGWHDAEEIRREFGKVDDECGAYFRTIAAHLRERAL